MSEEDERELETIETMKNVREDHERKGFEPAFRNGRTLKNRAYFERGTNSVVLEVDPFSSAKAVRSVILDGAKTYNEIYSKIAGDCKKQLKDTRYLMHCTELYGSFTDYMCQKKHYEELKTKLADAEKGKATGPRGKPIEPKVIVRGLETFETNPKAHVTKEYSKALHAIEQGVGAEMREYFRELLDEVKNDAFNEKEKRRDKYEFAGGFFNFRMGPVPNSHYKKKYDKAIRNYEALDYMSKKLEFREPSSLGAPAAKNTASYARKA